MVFCCSGPQSSLISCNMKTGHGCKAENGLETVTILACGSLQGKSPGRTANPINLVWACTHDPRNGTTIRPRIPSTSQFPPQPVYSPIQLAPIPHSCTAGIHDGASERETPGTLRGTTYQFSARRIPGLGGDRLGGNPGKGVLRNSSASKHFEGKHTLRGFRHTNISARHLYPRGIRASLKPLWAEDWFCLNWFFYFKRSVFKAHSTFCSSGILRAYISVSTRL